MPYEGCPERLGRASMQGGRVMNDYSVAYVAFDTAKMRHAVAIAEDGRTGEVRFLGEIESTEAAAIKLVKKLANRYRHLTFCYEAGLLIGVGSRRRSASQAIDLPSDGG